MQVQTERGIIFVKTEYDNVEKAKEEGYSYSFTSHQLNKDVYGKCLDDKGYRHEFALVTR